jgi:hypothetical protein
LIVKIEWTNKNPDTIWNKLATKLGREPTNEEAAAEVKRILAEATISAAMEGKLPYQRKR